MATKKTTKSKAVQQAQPKPSHEKSRSAGAEKSQKVLKETEDTMRVYAKRKGGAEVYLFDDSNRPAAARKAASLGYHHTSLVFIPIKKKK